MLRDGDISRLLQLAGPRDAVPAEVTARVFASAREEWRSQVRARRRRHRAIAAGVVLGAALAAVQAVRMAPRPVAPAPGPALFVLERAVGQGVVSGEPRAGEWLATPRGVRASWRTAGGGSLRMDEQTRVRVLSASMIWLEQGAVYFDGGSGQASRLEVGTRAGRVRDVGTQFEVRATPQQTEVRVREGQVILLSELAGVHEASAGFGLVLGRGPVERTEAPRHGPSWSWVEEAAPELPLEGRSLTAFLGSVARETGWEIRLSKQARARAGVILHGSASGLTPTEALLAVLPTCGLELRLENGIAILEPARR